MRFLVLSFSLVFLVLISNVCPHVSAFGAHTQVQPPERQVETSPLQRKAPEVSTAVETEVLNDAAPVVEAWDPKTGSIDTVIYLSGYGLYSSDSNKTKTLFIQNGVEFRAYAAGGWWTDDNHNLPQTLGVIVPEKAVFGEAQIVVEHNGRRSDPVTITITKWKLPVIHRLDPTRGAPGTLVRIESEGLHITDELVITDVNGKPFTVNQADGPAFRIPADAPEGILTVQVGNHKYGKEQLTDPVTFTVTKNIFDFRF